MAERALDRARALDAAGRTTPGRCTACRSRSRTTCARAGVPTTASSKILAGFVPPYNATVVERLEAGRRGHHRQDQPRRVRDGLVHRELGARPVEESVGRDAHARRIERRIGGGGRGAHGAAGARLRHRRIDPPARGALRHRRASSRPTAASRATACWRLPRRSIRSARSRLTVEDAALVLAGDRRLRPARLDLVAGADARSARRADRRRQGPAHRRAARVSRRRRRCADVLDGVRVGAARRWRRAARRSWTSSCRTPATAFRSTT